MKYEVRVTKYHKTSTNKLIVFLWEIQNEIYYGMKAFLCEMEHHIFTKEVVFIKKFRMYIKYLLSLK